MALLYRRKQQYKSLVIVSSIYAEKREMKYKVRYRYNNKKKEVFYLTNLKLWHVLKDQTGKRLYCFYDKDMPILDFGEPDPMDGKEEIPYVEWTAKDIAQIMSNILQNSGASKLAFLPKTVIQAMEDCGLDEQRKAGVMREILETIASNQLN